MKDSFTHFSNKSIFIITALTAIIAPLFFLPTTFEFYEFNKFTALLILTVVGSLSWSIKMILEKRFTFTRTPLDIPLLILIAVFFVASLSSLDQFVSLVGSQSRIWPSFLTFTTVAVFYFLAVSNLKTRNQVHIILWLLTGATTLASLVSIASYFGLFLPFDFAQNRGFSPLGVSNRIAFLQAIVIPISIYWSAFSRDKITRAASIIISAILILSLILINSLPSYVALAAGIAVLSFGPMKTKLDKHAKSALSVLGVITLLFLVLRFVPQVSSGTLSVWISQSGQSDQVLQTPQEITIQRKASWDVAAQTIGKRPLLGTGPSTFKFAYTQLKPRFVNITEEWAVRFEKGSSDIAEIITTTGILGTLAYLFFIITIARYLWSLVYKSQNSTLYLPIVAPIVAFIVGSFVTTSSISTAIPFFILLALLSTLAKAAGESHVYDITVELAALKDKFAWFPLGSSEDLIKTTEGKGGKSQILPSIFFLTILLISLVALRYQFDAYRGEYFYRFATLGRIENDGNKTISNLQKAIQANPNIDTYHRTLSEISLNGALNLSSQEGLSSDQQQLLSQLVQVAIDQGKISSGYQILPLKLPGISAINVANWEVLAAVYQAMIGSVEGAETHAVNTLTQAVNLDPQNPILHDRLGVLYQRIQNQDLAQRKFEDSIIVKGDYGPAHYHLAKLLIEKKGDVTRIVNELNLAKRFLPQTDQAIPDIEKELETYNARLQELQENPNQESQTDEGTTSPGPSPSPSASPSPSPNTSPSPSPSPSPSI